MKDRPAILLRHRTIGRHIREHPQLLEMVFVVANNDENTTKKKQIYDHQNFEINCKNIRIQKHR